MSVTDIRDQFPIAESYAYLNHASISPLPRGSAEAMQRQVKDVARQGVHAFPGWVREYEQLRCAAASMLGCDADEIAITKNTSEGLSAIANGLDWRSGDTIVGLESDFPANYVPWRELQARHGVRFHSLRLRNGVLDLEELDQACKGARLAALSYVHFLTGFRWNLKAVGEVCRRRDCVLVLDAVQGMGPFEIDVKACGVHALSAGGHKWLLGPEGCGIFYVDRSWMPAVRPVEFGWTSLEGFESYRSDGDLQPGARRFECGTLNTVGCVGLRTSIELLNEIGADHSSATIHALVERVLEAARSKGYEAAAKRNRENGSGIVSLRKPGVDPAKAVADLREDGVSAAERMGWIRVAPHVYNTDAEIDRLVELLP